MNRKEEILELTTELIQTMGFDSFSYKDLSERLGITKASIHHHFPKKEDLGLAFCERLLEMMTHFTQEFDQNGKSSWEKLEMVFQLHETQSDHCKKMCPIGSLQNDLHIISDEMKELLKAIEETQLSFFTKILEQGLQEGEMQFEGKAENQALVMTSALKGSTQSARLGGNQIISRILEQLRISLRP